MASVSIYFPDFSYFCKVVESLLYNLADNGILLISDQRLGDIYSHSKYLTIEPEQLVIFLNQLNYPFTIKCQSKEKRQIVKGRYDIIIYKDNCNVL
jgi:hypothetical protein